MREGRIFSSGYHEEEGELIFDLHGRDVEGEKFHLEVHDTTPYFFTKKEVKAGDGRIVDVKKEGKTLNNEELTKVCVEKPYHVPKIRDAYKPHFEADVMYKYRVRYDNSWKNYIKFPDRKDVFEEDVKPTSIDERVEPRSTVLDIEVMDDEGYEEPDDAGKMIVCVTLYDSRKDRYVCIFVGDYEGSRHIELIDEHLQKADVDIDYELVVHPVRNEDELFDKLRGWFVGSKPDVATGWNYIQYDDKYIRNRAKRIHKRHGMEGVEPFDLMQANSSLTEGKTRDKLDIQAKKILGVGKLGREKICDMYGRDNARIIAYNVVDVILTKEINEQKELIPFYLRLSHLTGNNLGDCDYFSKMADSYVFYRVQGAVRLPSKEFVPKQGLKGAHVGERAVRLLKNIAVVDFKTEYPLLMIVFNLSPDTYEHTPREGVDYITTPNGNHYRKDEEGLVVKILTELMEERDEIKAEMKGAKAQDNMDEYDKLFEMQRALKFFTNSFFGLVSSGKATFRLSNEDVGGDVTAFGREHIKFTSERLEEMGYPVLYDDTDSQFIQLKSDTYEGRQEELDEIVEKLNDSYDEFVEKYNADKNMLRIDKDKVFKRWIQTGVSESGAKKRYAGILEWDDVDMREKDYKDKLYVRGFEIRRVNTAEITTEAQKRVLKMVLTGPHKEEARNYLLNTREGIWDGKYDVELGVNGVITKPPEEYKTKQSHVKAWEWLNDNGYDLGIRDPFLWYYCDDGVVRGVPQGREIPEKVSERIDYERMWQRNVVNKVEPFLRPVISDFDMNMFLEGKKQASLGDYDVD